MNLIVQSYLDSDKKSYKHFTNAIQELQESGDSVLPIFDYELEKIKKTRKPKICIDNGDLRKIKRRKRKTVKLVLFLEKITKKEEIKKIVKKIEKYYQFKYFDLFLDIERKTDKIEPEDWYPLFEMVSRLHIGWFNNNINIDFDIKNPNLKEFSIMSNRNSVINLFDKIPETVEYMKLLTTRKNIIDMFVSKISRRLPNLKKLDIHIIDQFIKIGRFRNLLKLKLNIMKQSNFKFYKGYFKDTKLVKLEIHELNENTNLFRNELTFMSECPFPDSLKILKLTGYFEINKLGYISGDSLIRFLPTGLQELELPISGSLETTIEYKKKLVNLIPDVGILSIILFDKTRTIQNTVVIPDSVYFLKLKFAPVTLWYKNFSDMFIFGKNSQLKQIYIDLNDAQIFNLYVLFKLKHISRKIRVYIYNVHNNEEYINCLKNTIEFIKEELKNIVFITPNL